MDRRAELTDFLKSRRARIQPEDLGLKVFGGRRRVPGLRREELAQVAGVSADYYVRLEQGRADNVSEEILDAVADVLALDAAERNHLAQLAKPARKKRQRRTVQKVRPAVRQLIDLMDSVPAFVSGRRMEVLAGNRLFAALIADYEQVPRRERSLPRRVFLDESSRDFYPEWGKVAAEMVSYLHGYAGQHPDDPELAELVGELSIRSPEFRKLWARHDVRESCHGVKRMQHPLVGSLELRYETLELPADADQILVTYIAEPGSESEQALRLLASWAAPEHERAQAAPELR
jgi:transcriptional regulator with XRE-family HTH domain